jgi:poly(A) polymerase
LLGLEPKDYDVATDAPPDRVRTLFRRTQAVGQAFGVILVRVNRSQVEVATFRADGRYLDGRRPSEVRFTTAEEDAKRRDFTINGLFLDPVTDRVIDYVGGQADLKAKVIRAIGNPDERFEEDHLRLLRALRFAARFGFEIEPATDDAIRRHAGHLVRISPERVAEELRLMLTPPKAQRAWELLRELGLIDVIFRQWPAPPPLPAGAHRYYPLRDLPMHYGSGAPFGLVLATAMVMRWPRSNDPEGVLAALAPANINAAVRAARQSLKISNEEAEDFAGTLLDAWAMLRDPPPTLAQTKRLLARPTSRLARQLLGLLRSFFYFMDRIDTLDSEFTRLEKTDFAPPPLITGDDLTTAGYSPGPMFRRVLDGVYDAQLEDRVRTKDEAMELAGRMFAEGEAGRA